MQYLGLYNLAGLGNRFIFLLAIIPTNCGINAFRTSWVNNLVNFIRNDLQVYQVLLIYDQNSHTNPSTEETVFELSRNIPVWKLHYENATEKKARELSPFRQFRDPQATTLVILLSPPTLPMSFLSQISEYKTRPKVLIILEEIKEYNCDRLLRQMWSSRFLDATILELGTGKPKEESRNWFSKPAKGEATICYLEVFRNTTIRRKWSPKVPWFPEKTRDLHGYPIKVGAYNLPASFSLKQDATGNLVDVCGPDATMFKTLAQGMNFKPEWITSKTSDSGRPNSEKAKMTGLLKDIVNNEIQVIGPHAGRYGSSDARFYEWAIGTKNLKIIVVVPVLREDPLFSSRWNVYNIIALIGLLILTWILTHLLHFDRRNWEFLNFFLMMLGWPTSRQPEKMAERILFGSMLCGFLLYSTFVYTSFTQTSLEEQREKKFRTLQDVISSNLTPMVGRNLYPLLNKNAEGDARILLEKSELLDGTRLDLCLEILKERRNISCLVRDDIAQLMVKNEKDHCGRPIMKVVKEPFLSTVTGLILESASPYVRRFDEELLRLIQGGLPELWRKRESSKSNVVDEEESCSLRTSESRLIRNQLTYLLISGSLIGSVLLICELLVDYFMRRENRIIIL